MKFVLWACFVLSAAHDCDSIGSDGNCQVESPALIQQLGLENATTGGVQDEDDEAYNEDGDSDDDDDDDEELESSESFKQFGLELYHS